MKLYVVISCTQLCAVIQYYIILLLACDYFWCFTVITLQKCHFLNNQFIPYSKLDLVVFFDSSNSNIKEIDNFFKLKKGQV